MHKKLASDLTSLAHSILQMKNKEDVMALKEKAYEVYEKLALLAYVEEYINTTPHAEETKEELIQKIEKSIVAEKKEENEVVIHQLDEFNTELEGGEVENVIEEAIQEAITNEKVEEELEVVQDLVSSQLDEQEEVKETTEVVEEIIEQPFDELENLLFGEEEVLPEAPDVKKIEDHAAPTLEDELQDTLPVDVMADLFQKVEPQKTINDVLQNTIKIDLNDRIAFVNHLFNGDQADFNRVVSQLNTFKTEKEAKSFIIKMVKPDYDWSDKEEYETRLMEIIERRFA
ncbi:hypothetical protein ACOSP6_08555 [Tenacibaculum sp. MEBiC06402]|uniref:hypothetical protein n=1 Tax=unclassified Tenacibaculum TaxID=2635139 RepID=UPI003B99AA62